jgi:hypothetical protein
LEYKFFVKPLVINNFVDNDTQLNILNTLNNEQFPWYVIETVDDCKHSVQLASLIFRYDIPYATGYAPLMFILLEEFEKKLNVKIKHIERIKCNLLPSRGNPFINPFHCDLQKNAKTLLYYVNESDGDTVFYNEYYPSDKVTEQQRVKHSQGTAVIFDSNQYHSSSCPVNTKTRLTINCVLEIE